MSTVPCVANDLIISVVESLLACELLSINMQDSLNHENLMSAEYAPSLAGGLPVTDAVSWLENIHI